ncbi:MAG: DnaJ domain-containing protein [Bryobacterales bacterium]|nr:DnaJ domain-containing protein [Bryobacterales bacterium]
MRRHRPYTRDEEPLPAGSGGRGAPPYPPPESHRRSPFAILGVPRDASAAQVKQAYRRLCARHHPDVLPRHRPGQAGANFGPLAQPRPDGCADADTVFLEIQQAYHTLGDRYARAQWEREEQEWEWRHALLAGPRAAKIDPPAPDGDTTLQRALHEVGSRIREIASQIQNAQWLPLAGSFFREHALLSLALAGFGIAALHFGIYAHRDGPPTATASREEEAVNAQDAPALPQPGPRQSGMSDAAHRAKRMAGKSTHDGNPHDARQTARVKPRDDYQTARVKPRDASQTARVKPPDDYQTARVKPRDDYQTARVKPRDASQTARVKPGAAQPVLIANLASAGLGRDTPGSGLSESVDRPGHRAESGTGSGPVPEKLPNDSPHALTQAGEQAAPSPVRLSASAGEWHGRWAAICTANEGMDIYRGSLDITTEAHFRWVNLVNGKPESLGPLEIDPTGNGGKRLRLAPRGAVRTAGRRAGPERESAIAVLERAASSERWMTWRDVPGDTTDTSDLARRMQGAHAISGESSKPPPAGPCGRWRLFPDDGAAALDGLWVLPSDEKPAEGALASEYVELRMTRKDDRYNGRFVGRYRVPVASMPAEIRFGFSLPAAAMGWQPWENGDGATGKVLLTPVGRSRLVVFWKRGSAPSGGPHLSGGIAVLRRME